MCAEIEDVKATVEREQPNILVGVQAVPRRFCPYRRHLQFTASMWTPEQAQVRYIYITLIAHRQGRASQRLLTDLGSHVGDRGDREGDDPRAEDVQPAPRSAGGKGPGCGCGVYQGEHSCPP